MPSQIIEAGSSARTTPSPFRMAHIIKLDEASLLSLDLSRVQDAIALWGAQDSADVLSPLRFEIDYPRSPDDPRELSEIPEIRLWFIRLDVQYPWFPLLLDWQSGELARYAAMLVPHEFHRTEGIQYNPEALEIFVMRVCFAIAQHLQHQGLPSRSKLMNFARVFGYELDDDFFALLESPS